MTEGKERRAQVVALRRGGHSFREIGDKLGISASRAGQLYNKGVGETAGPPSEEDYSVDTPFAKLPIGPQSRAALELYGVPLSELVRRERRALCADMLRLPQCNRRAWTEIEGVLDRCVQVAAGTPAGDG